MHTIAGTALQAAVSAAHATGSVAIARWTSVLCNIVEALYTVSVMANEAAYKGKQMLSDGEKSRNATLDGYFAQEFVRAFAGEAYSDPVRMRRQQRLLSKAKYLSKDWMPTDGIKMPLVSRNLSLIVEFSDESEYSVFHNVCMYSPAL